MFFAWILAMLAAATAVMAAEPTPARRAILVGMDNNYPPYVFQAADGKLQGILIDQWRLWEKKTGIAVQIEAMDWGEALAGMRAGRFDVIDTIFRTPEREAIYDFTAPYARIEVPVFFRKEISGITDLESLRGFPVAAKTGDAVVDLLTAHGIDAVLRFHNYAAIVEAAQRRQINVFAVDAPPALYFLNKSGLADEFRRTAPINVGEFHRAVQKGNTELLRTVETGFAQLTAAELKAIDEKWFGLPLGSRRFLAYAAYAAAAALLAIGALVIWNRALQRVVSRRTAELQESEARFRQVVENIQEVFWMSDATNHRTIYISPGYETIWGRTCASLYADPASWLESIHPDDRARVREAVATKQKENTYDEVYRVLRPDGATRWVRDRGFCIRHEDGRPRRFVGVAEDITERKLLEERFLRGQRMEALGMLSGGIAHDLNNILAPILLSTALLRDNAASESDRRLLALLENNTKRGAELIRQLLIFSRGSPGQRTRTDVAAVLEEVAAIIRTTFPRNITLKLDVQSDVPAVLADPTQLHQVLLNLGVNARDAMPGGGTLTLTAGARHLDETTAKAHPGARPGEHVVIGVEDTGAGIPPEIVDRIFEPFFTTKGIGRGSGLGLSTVLGITKSHDGFVTVKSEEGRGSTFLVFLPAAVSDGIAAVTTMPAEEPGGRGELILLVDDEPLVRQTTQQALERNGYAVLAVTTGEDAVSLFVENKEAVRLVMTDVMMPGMGGAALVRVLRSMQPGVRVIAATGMAGEGHEAELAALGVTELLRKPYDLRAMLEAVRRELGGADA